MELHRFFRYAIEKMCKEKKSLNHFNNNNVTVFRKRGNSSASLQATDGEVADNIGYIIGDFYLNLWQEDTPPLENAEKIQKLDASPFESLDKSTGTYVLKPEYQGYGATIE